MYCLHLVYFHIQAPFSYWFSHFIDNFHESFQKIGSSRKATVTYSLFCFVGSDGDAGSFNRIFVLESRAAERQTLGQILYFPVIFCMFGIIIGWLNVYFS